MEEILIDVAKQSPVIAILSLIIRYLIKENKGLKIYIQNNHTKNIKNLNTIANNLVLLKQSGTTNTDKVITKMDSSEKLIIEKMSK